jgi:FkbM family methyltransferase
MRHAQVREGAIIVEAAIICLDQAAAPWPPRNGQAVRLQHEHSDSGVRQMNKLLRVLMRAVCSLRNRNAFVYYQSIVARVPLPGIPVILVEQYGQCGEDLIVAALITARAFREGCDPGSLRYLEVGGNHPFATSATFLLHVQLGMTGVIVEANSALIPALRKGRPNDVIIHAAVTDNDEPTAILTVSRFSELSSLDPHFSIDWSKRSKSPSAIATGKQEVSAIRINQIVKKYMDDGPPCFMSIDIEGLDLVVLQDFDFKRYRPWLVQVEPSDDYIPGNSHKICQYMGSVGYRLLAKTDVNMIFGAD